MDGPESRRASTPSRLCAILLFAAAAALASVGSPALMRSKNGTWGKGRRLHGADDTDGPGDYSNCSCGDILTETSAADPAERCAYAHTCNGGSGLLLPSVFCGAGTTADTYRMCALLSPALLLWLVLLFRMLGSTAEDFFAPSPEMLSRRLGLPPRFAGASLLALGNGAPDISATVNAIASDPTNGYNLSLGALTGGGMFVGTIVAGAVIVAEGGVPCRGALVRDLASYVLGILLVLFCLRRDYIGGWAVASFFSLYVLYASMVLAADMYHRVVVVPKSRLREEREALELQAGIAEERQDVDEERLVLSSRLSLEEVSDKSSSQDKRSPSMQSASDQNGHSPEEKEKRIRQPTGAFAGRMLAHCSNYSKLSTHFDKPLVLHGREGVLSSLSHHHHFLSAPDQQSSPLSTVEEDLGETEALIDKEEGNCPSCVVFHSVWRENMRELGAHWEGILHDSFFDKKVHVAEKIMLALELPFTILRKVSIPVPCEDYYCRPVVSIAIALSPLWIGIYARSKYGADFFFSGGIPYTATIFFSSFSLGACVWMFANEEDMPTIVAGPIALYGFVVAATWIDFVGDQLVSLLEFLGVILNIPSSVMGLTVLAWGNSMGDLAANIALAKKGFANMAVTACFAGPLFNMLIGLGCSFVVLGDEAGRKGMTVSLSPAVSTGFFFLVCNCVMLATCGLFLHGGTIPVGYGYVMFGVYACFIAASVVLQYMKRPHH